MSTTRSEHRHVAVVIPVYNGGAYVESAIESALGQSLRPASVVVVDDGSTDDTRDRVRKIASTNPLVVLIEQPNAGVSAARNAGVRRTTADLVAFLDCDDVWYASKLREQVEYLEANPDCVVVGTRMDYYGRGGKLPGVVGEPTPDARQDDMRRGTYMPMQLSSWMVRRWAFDRAGGFDEDLGGLAEDVDLLARLARLGTVRILPGRSLGGYRLHETSASSASFFASRSAVRFVRARLAARDAGGDLSYDEFREQHLHDRAERGDRAKFAFRQAGVALAQRRVTSGVAKLVHAVLLDPRYAVRRLWMRTVRTLR